MKILTKEEEDAHYNETLKGGLMGGLAGLGLGIGGVWGAARRFPAFRHLTIPLRVFLASSSATFGAIITADHFSRAFEAARRSDAGFKNETERQQAIDAASRSNWEKFMAFGKEYRYYIVAGSWVLSMGLALGLVGRSPHLSNSQKLVQARVYAQGLTVAVILASASFEISDQGKGEGRWETKTIVDPNDPKHQHLVDKKVHKESYAGEDTWMDMVEAEEEKHKRREEHIKELTKEDKAKIRAKQREEKKAKAAEEKGKGNGKDSKAEGKEESQAKKSKEAGQKNGSKEDEKESKPKK